MNHKIRNIQKTLLSDNWYTLNKFSFEYQNQHGQWQLQHREAYDRGNGATILLYNKAKGNSDPDTSVSDAYLYQR